MYNLYPPATNANNTIYLYEDSNVFPLLGGCRREIWQNEIRRKKLKIFNQVVSDLVFDVKP